MIRKGNMVPQALSSLTALNIIYSLVAATIVGLYTFNTDLWIGAFEDKSETEQGDRRDNIILATIIFLTLTAIIGLAFFVFHKHDQGTETYYQRFIIIYGILFIAFATLTGLQFYYYEDDGNEDDIYKFTRWWPLASLVLILAIIYTLFRFKSLV